MGAETQSHEPTIERPPSTAQVARMTWERFDEMPRAIRDGDVHAFITTPPVRAWGLDSLALGSTNLLRGIEGAAVVASGDVAGDRVAFFLTGDRSGSRRCDGEELDSRGVYRWAPGTEISNISRRPTEWLALTVTEQDFRRSRAVLEGETAALRPIRSRASTAAPANVASFRTLLGEAIHAAEEAGLMGLHPEAARFLDERLRLVAAGLFSDDAEPAAPRLMRARYRARILSDVEGFLAAAGSEPVYISALCERLGLPERTLRYVFEEQFGASPMRVLRARRLCEVRLALRSAAAGTRVSAVAGRFGFWHLGQFATDYRALFGERPSETLRSSRTPAGPKAGREGRGLASWAATAERLG